MSASRNHDSAAFGQLKTDGTATIAEIRQFLGQIKGRDPQEVLGLDSGGLMSAMVQATIGTIVLMLVMTVIPHFMPAAAAPAAAPTPAPVAATPSEAPVDPTKTAAGDAGTGSSDAGLSDREKAAKNLNMQDEVKPATATPGNLDNLLDGAK